MMGLKYKPPTDDEWFRERTDTIRMELVISLRQLIVRVHDLDDTTRGVEQDIEDIIVDVNKLKDPAAQGDGENGKEG